MGVVKTFVIIFLCVAIFGPSAYFFHRLFIAPGQIERMEKSRPRAPLPPDASIAEFDKCLKLKNSGDLLAARTARWIALGAAGYTLYTDAPVADGAKPPAGLGLDAEEMEELSTLLNKNTPVTIQ